MPAVSGSPTQLAASVTTLANLGGLPDDAYKDGDFAYVQSTRATYQLDRTLNATPSAVAVDTFSGNGQWVFFLASKSWETQTAWYIDPAAGNDENDGATTTTALATWAEFCRRVKTINGSVTCTLLSDTTEALIGSFVAGANDARLSISGTPTIIASGGGPGHSTIASPVPATNTRGSVAVDNMVTSGGVPTTVGAYVGYLLRAPADPLLPNAGPFLWPILRDNAGNGEGGYWARASSSNTAPSSGTTVEVLQLTTVPVLQISAPAVSVYVYYLSFTATSQLDSPFVFSGLPIDGFLLSGPATIYGPFIGCAFANAITVPPSPSYFIACLWTAGGKSFVLAGPPMYLIGGGALGAITMFGAGSVFGLGFHVEGGKLSIGSTNFSGAIVLNVLSTPVGVFAAPANAVEVIGTGRLSAVTIYGDDNVGYGLSVSTGGTAQFTGTPTITDLTDTKQVQINGAVTAVPPLGLTAPLADVPLAAPLTTWAQWIAAPFSRNVVSYLNGSKICGS